MHLEEGREKERLARRQRNDKLLIKNVATRIENVANTPHIPSIEHSRQLFLT